MNGRVYRACLNLLGNPDKAHLVTLEKLDLFLLNGSISQEEYTDLVGRLE